MWEIIATLILIFCVMFLGAWFKTWRKRSYQQKGRYQQSLVYDLLNK